MRKIKNMEPVPKLKKRNSGTGSDINTKAFTLIELLVVITILAILATIWLVSFQSYNTFARNSVRLWNLKTIESWLWIQYVQSWNYALPDDSVNITASGTTIRKQWVFWKNALRTVWVSKNGSTDPLTQEYFDYSVWTNLQEYQLVAYLEWDEANNSGQAQGIAPTSYANIWTMKSMWQDLWIVFSWWLEVHKISPQPEEVDVIKDNKEYTVKFSEWDEITSSWSLLFSSIYNHSKNLLKNKDLAKLDDSLVLYFDMETTTQSWSLTVLKDFSKYENNGEFKNNPIFQEWIFGKWIFFDWKQHITSKDSDSLNINTNKYTILAYFNFSVESENLLNLYPELIWKRPFKVWWYAIHFSKSSSSIVNQYCYLWWCFNNVLPSKIIKNEWNYFVSSKEEQKLKSYFNWSYNSDTSINNIMWDSSWTDLRVWQNFQWTIDEVRIYNRTLSEEEIKNVYGSTLN